MWGVAAAALMIVGLVTTASAHTAPITASCEAGLSVSLTDYNADGVNTVRVWIDGTERATTAFGASTSVSFAFGDPTVTHNWRVSVSAFDDPTGAIGWSFDTGTNTIPVCAGPTTTAPATSAPGVTVPVTTAPTATLPAPTVSPTVPPTVVTVASVVITAPSGPSGAPATTAVVAQAPPTVPVVGADSGGLPVTGQPNMSALGLALLLFGFGILLIVAMRRPDAA